jgi:hypothetical protein
LLEKTLTTKTTRTTYQKLCPLLLLLLLLLLLVSLFLVLPPPPHPPTIVFQRGRQQQDETEDLARALQATDLDGSSAESNMWGTISNHHCIPDPLHTGRLRSLVICAFVPPSGTDINNFELSFRGNDKIIGRVAMPTELYNATDTLGMLGANESTILSQQGHMDRLQDRGNDIYGPEAITKVLTIPEGRRVRAEFVEMTTLLPTHDPIAVARIPTASSTALEIIVFLCVTMLEVPPDEQYGTPIPSS